MISARAMAAFDRIAMDALRSVASADAGAVVQLTRTPPLDAEARSVVMSISEYKFRLVIFFHFEDDKATLAHVARLCRDDVAALSDRQVADTVCEWANMYCGAISRELGRVFPHIGMSTPNILERRVVTHVARLKPGHVSHIALKPGAGPSFASTLCVCDFGDVDFDVEARPVQASDVAGELEMF
jgi:hypothetical protein